MRSPSLVVVALVALGGCSSSKSSDARAPEPLDTGAQPSASASTNLASASAAPTLPRGPGPGGTDASLPPAALPPATDRPLANATPAASASAAAAPAPTLDIKSNCPDTLRISIGPNTSSLSDVTIPGRSTVSVKRDADGSQTAWIVAAKKAPPTPTRATAATKRLVIDLDCRSMRAE